MDYNFGEASHKVFRTRFVTELRSATPVWRRLRVELWAYEPSNNNQRLGHSAFSRSSHNRRKKFATGPIQHCLGNPSQLDVAVSTNPAASPLHPTWATP